MSTSNLGLGVAFPKMLPITGTWAIPISLYSVFLANRVVYYRLVTKTLNGDTPADAAASKDPHPMSKAVRAFGNYVETAPFAIALAAILELNGANKKTLHYSLGVYLLSRVLHLEGGIMQTNSMGVGRPVGYYGTQALLVGSAFYLATLVKGYWGF